jgi:hypothetical protein
MFTEPGSTRWYDGMASVVMLSVAADAIFGGEGS